MPSQLNSNSKAHPSLLDVNASSGRFLTGINVLSLWASASVQGFAAPIWMTYRQAVELRAHVRKGEKGSPVVYANSITRNETDSGVEVARDIHFLKGYTVFNVEQIDGLPAHYTAPASPRLDVSARIARAEMLLRGDWCHAHPRR
jgi:antirestriction protein ArdC